MILATEIVLVSLRVEKKSKKLKYKSKAINQICHLNKHNLFYLLSGDREGIINIWNLQNKEKFLISIKAHDKMITKFYELKSVKAFVSISSDQYIKIWDLNDFKNIHSIKTIYSNWSVEEYSINSNLWLIGVGSLGIINFFTLQGEFVKKINLHKGYILNQLKIKESLLFLTASNDGLINLIQTLK